MTMDKNTIDPAKSIPTFYAGQSIFLTGATGFLGKVFIEKVLRSCPDIREIFILMRPKKGLSLNERLEKMLNLPLYDKLREKQPLIFKKLIVVSGDTSQENLGLSAVDRQMLTERVTITIHNAASVKFNDSLKYAILTNTRSTRDICILAESMKNLMALVYISTAYAHLDNPFIEEKVYPPIANWRKMIKMAESLDEHILNVFTAKCLNNIPNTYIFSKILAESVIQEYSSSLPCAIVRPSMVIHGIMDPIPGWIDNFNGPVGFYCFGGKGLLRVVYASNYISQNHIPIDTVINIIILVIWKLGLTKYDHQFICIIYTLYIHTYICMYNMQHRILELQRKAYVSNRAVQHFTRNEWKFDNTNSQDLMLVIPSDNRKMFSIDLSDMDMTKYLRNAIIGAKIYLLHEDMNRLEAAKAHRKK
ncbi:fatty acyl-CoA reductase 1-like [Formica exsecta]|uniref:fatty acyl-CoA reductase 1-like n=1 Tax=Formica exsecta TaxID=72781 RepID=UPI0011430C63|nr:fatty acyl-CoA reductase 1-like [Formica exsecta]